MSSFWTTFLLTSQRFYDSIPIPESQNLTFCGDLFCGKNLVMDIFIQGIRSLSPTGWYWCRYRCCGVRTLLMLIGVVVVLLVFTGVVVHILLIVIHYWYCFLLLCACVACGVWRVWCVWCGVRFFVSVSRYGTIHYVKLLCKPVMSTTRYVKFPSGLDTNKIAKKNDQDRKKNFDK